MSAANRKKARVRSRKVRRAARALAQQPQPRRKHNP